MRHLILLDSAVADLVGILDHVIPGAPISDRYARRVGVAAAREINTIPGARPTSNGQWFGRLVSAGSQATVPSVGVSWIGCMTNVGALPYYPARWVGFGRNFGPISAAPPASVT